MATRKRHNDEDAQQSLPPAKRMKLSLVAPPLQPRHSVHKKGFVSLQRLSIQGVRSFPPSTSQTIIFEEPLTLIEGPNGVGKTTVMEALRYATTGAVPPGPNGLAARLHTFVHQPSHTIVPWPQASQAIVQLTFRNTRDDVVTVKRQVSLTMRDNLSLQAKTHSVRLTVAPTDGGEKVKRTISSKKIGPVMVEHFNVSAAILDSVLFVHQSEANWPLSSAQELKDRIDKILETNVQTKALDEFGKYRKQCERERGKLEIELAKWAEAVQTKQRTQLRLHDLEGEASAAKEQLTSLHHEANTLEIKVSQAQSQANKANVAPTMRPLLRNIERVLQSYRQDNDTKMEGTVSETVSFLIALKTKQTTVQTHVATLTEKRQPLDTAFTEAQNTHERAQEAATQAATRYAMLTETAERSKLQLDGTITSSDALQAKLDTLDDRIQRSYAQEAQRARLQDALKRLAVAEAKLKAQRAKRTELEKVLVDLGPQDALDAQIQTVNAHIQAFHEAQARGTVARDAQLMLEKAQSNCPVCIQPLDDTRRSELLRKYQHDKDGVPTATVLQGHKQELKALRAKLFQRLSAQQALEKLEKTLTTLAQEHETEAKKVATLREALHNVPSDEEIATLRATQSNLAQQLRAQRAFEKASKELDNVLPVHQTAKAAVLKSKEATEQARKALSECDNKLNALAQQAQTVRQLLQVEHDLRALKTCVAPLTDKEDIDAMPLLQSKTLPPVPQIIAQLTARRQQYESQYTGYAQDKEKASELLQHTKDALARVKQRYHEQRGRHDALSQQCNELQAQLEDEHYREADLNHARLTRQIALYTRAIDDMKRYHRARADAIVRYHQETITEINRILDELWKQSYQGGDIETIRIVSERRKNTHIYDYRVVMQMVGATESQVKDMRAYASRGQQVLAALMIRFAFARAFSLHTNLLVLDEPTTNLDAEHVRMLANTLKRIIAMHAKGTLQLVVITHNRAFVEQLCKSQHADYYYRLSRTPYTTVEKKPIRTL